VGAKSGSKQLQAPSLTLPKGGDAIKSIDEIDCMKIFLVIVVVILALIYIPKLVYWISPRWLKGIWDDFEDMSEFGKTLVFAAFMLLLTLIGYMLTGDSDSAKGNVLSVIKDLVVALFE
jgi:hypothetical protein